MCEGGSAPEGALSSAVRGLSPLCAARRIGELSELPRRNRETSWLRRAQEGQTHEHFRGARKEGPRNAWEQGPRSAWEQGPRGAC